MFADQLIGKAKRSLEIEGQTTVKKKQTESANDHFNIPDLVKANVVNSKRKELEELAQIQRQIEDAKRQLKIIPDDAPVPEKSKSPQVFQEDDDFLNLKADELDEEENPQSAKTNELSASPASMGEVSTEPSRNRSPIVFGNFKERRHGEVATKERPPTTTGENIISLSAHRQVERELYTPVHRRESSSNVERHETTRPRRRLSESRDRIRRSGERNNRRSPVRLERSPRETRRPRERQPALAVLAAAQLQPKSRARRGDRSVVDIKKGGEPLNVRQRMGSRVIVAPPKTQYDEEEIDVPISSVVTIKPRPIVAKNRQANKNLLLRAMAEAQKSMVGTLRQQQHQQIEAAAKKLPKTLKVIELQASIGGGGGIKSRLGGTIGTKRQINAIVSSLDAVVKRQRPNEKIIIEIGPNDDDDDDADDDEEGELVLQDNSVQSELEYVPKPVDTLSHAKEADGEVRGATVKTVTDSTASNTQFVVTLDGAFKSAGGVRKRVEVQENRTRKSPVLDLPAATVATPRATNRGTGTVTASERSPRHLVDLRQRVEDKRNGSPGKHSSVVGVEGNTARKRRSPISFREKLRELVNENESKDVKRPELKDAPQRKRIRVTESPSKMEKDDVVRTATTNGDEGKSKIVVVGKERRNPKKYENIPPRK